MPIGTNSIHMVHCVCMYTYKYVCYIYSAREVKASFVIELLRTFLYIHCMRSHRLQKKVCCMHYTFEKKVSVKRCANKQGESTSIYVYIYVLIAQEGFANTRWNCMFLGLWWTSNCINITYYVYLILAMKTKKYSNQNKAYKQSV